MRQFYLVFISVTIMIMGGIFLLQRTPRYSYERDPADIIWMEQIRRSTMNNVSPVRERIRVVGLSSTGISIDSEFPVPKAVATVNEAERRLALDILDTARQSVIRSSEWQDENLRITRPTPHRYRNLFQVKDHLWELTLSYIETLEQIYSESREVESSELRYLDNQISIYKARLNYEMMAAGLEQAEY